MIWLDRINLIIIFLSLVFFLTQAIGGAGMASLMNPLLLVVATLILVTQGLWARGLIRSKRGDLVAASCVSLTLFFALGLLDVGAGMSVLGMVLLGFGVITLVVEPCAMPPRLFSRTLRYTLVIAFLLLGFLSQLLM